MSFLYFAYGSNMLSSRLIARCPSARVVGTASADQHALEFSKLSEDGSGKATLIEDATAVQTPGVLFEIELGEREALDRFEGAGSGYDRFDGFCVVTRNETVTATTYLASHTTDGLNPYDWYLALVIAGVLEHELSDGHANRLRKMSYEVDENETRKSRIAALQALSDHGHDDHVGILAN